MNIKDLVARFSEIAVELGVPPEKGAAAGQQCFNSMAKMSEKIAKESDIDRRRCGLPVLARPAPDVALAQWLTSRTPEGRDAAIRNNVRPYVPLYEKAAEVPSADTTNVKREQIAVAAQTVPPGKPFEVGGVKFSALRRSFPISHWLVRIEETGEVLQAGAGGISNESVPKMIASLEELLARVSKGDVQDFRKRMDLPDEAVQKAARQGGYTVHPANDSSQGWAYCIEGDYSKEYRSARAAWQAAATEMESTRKAKDEVALGVSEATPAKHQLVAPNAATVNEPVSEVPVSELLAALEKLLPHVMHYASFPHAHSDAHRDAAYAIAAIAKTPAVAAEEKRNTQALTNGMSTNPPEPVQQKIVVELKDGMVRSVYAETSGISLAFIEYATGIENDSAVLIPQDDGRFRRATADFCTSQVAPVRVAELYALAERGPTEELFETVNEGVFSGPILQIVDGVATQKIGRDGSTVKHDASFLSAAVKVGQDVNIKYRSGMGIVSGLAQSAGVER